jgi:hypothetical protein
MGVHLVTAIFSRHMLINIFLSMFIKVKLHIDTNLFYNVSK